MSDYPSVNETENGYSAGGLPRFGKTFVRARSFHAPEGLAAVEDDTGAFHIDEYGNARYPQRYLEAAGFYGGIAAVRDVRGWFHIRTDGSALHERRLRWSGNFQCGRCAVLDQRGFFHIDTQGCDAYPDRFRYAGDYRDGIAVVHNSDGAFHIGLAGTPLHSARFRDAQPFHKGHAVVADDAGYFHVDKRGQPVHTLRFDQAEPFYNGAALCRANNGQLLRLRENGTWTWIADNLEPISAADIRVGLEAGQRIGLFIRHAERHAFPPADPEWGNNVLLTERGIQTATALGRELGVGQQLRFWSSPVQRCRQTCEAIAAGAAVAAPIVSVHTHLGDPGIYFDGTGLHEEPMRKDFHAFATPYLNQGVAPGMRAVPEASQQLLAFVTQQIAESHCTIFVTHDFFAAALMSYLGLKAPDKVDWCQYLEGVCVIVDKGEVRYRRFLGQHELPRC